MGRIEQALAKAKISKSSGRVQRRRLDVTPGVGSSSRRLADVCKQRLEIPEDVLLEHRLVAASDDQKANGVDEYKMLRTKVLHRLSSNNWRLLAVTSTRQGEGKTLTAMNLAISISRDRNYDVVLVDTDLRSPSIHEMMGVAPPKGLSEYLEGTATFEEILFSPGIEGLGVIPNRHPIENSCEALMSPRMGELLGELRGLNPAVLVVFDLPPLIVDDALAFAPFVDSLMLVFKVGLTNRDEAAAAREMIAELPTVGCVVNGDTNRRRGAYY